MSLQELCELLAGNLLDAFDDLLRDPAGFLGGGAGNWFDNFMEELNTPIFAQAKIEYTKQLVEILYPHMFDGVKSIYDESKIIYSTKFLLVINSRQ